MQIPSKFLENAICEISKLPGIGPKSAMRMALYLLKESKIRSKAIALALDEMIDKVKICKNCCSICDGELCKICSSPNRDSNLICVVEDIRDVIAIENTSQYKGLYHVLGGKISPIEEIAPSNLTITHLLERIQKANSSLEIIFALSNTMEGDTTILYIYEQLKDFKGKITTLPKGISVGYELEYVDELTLGRSILDRIALSKVFYDLK